MQARQGSLTAKSAASHRALESEKSPEQRICYDPFARKFIGQKCTALGEIPLPQGLALWLYQKGWPGFHDYFAARTRHLDEYLQRGLEAGIRQLVILGAGYDARAYRIEGLRRKVKVFEVDHPATQQEKLAKLRDMSGDVPHDVVYVAIDFQQHTLGQCLQASGYDATLMTLFLWEGVTYYLSAMAVDETLRFVRQQSGPGSSIIFDYTTPDVIAGTCPRKEAKIWRKYVNKAGEELTFGIAHDQMQSFLEQRGFAQIDNADSAWLAQAYFTKTHQHRTITPIFAIVSATVMLENREKGEDVSVQQEKFFQSRA